MNTSHQFSKSLQVAISFLSNFTEAVSGWKNFTWFHKIVMSEFAEFSKAKDSINALPFKKIKRRILFYGHRNSLIATVLLEGNEFTNTDSSKSTFWKVTEVHYVNNYDETVTSFKPKWTEVKIEEKDQKLM